MSSSAQDAYKEGEKAAKTSGIDVNSDPRFMSPEKKAEYEEDVKNQSRYEEVEAYQNDENTDTSTTTPKGSIWSSLYGGFCNIIVKAKNFVTAKIIPWFQEHFTRQHDQEVVAENDLSAAQTETTEEKTANPGDSSRGYSTSIAEFEYQQQQKELAEQRSNMVGVVTEAASGEREMGEMEG